MKSLSILLACMFFGLFQVAFAEDYRIQFNDDGKYSHGQIKDDGRLEVYDKEGNYSQGRIREDGRF